MPLDTLQKLMDHRTAVTTQIYYRVTWARKREAIERLAPLTMDKDGRRVGFVSSLVESERLREEIGRIPVPLGYCTEQHNVRALGAHCPFSHQCPGCEHFRTDQLITQAEADGHRRLVDTNIPIRLNLLRIIDGLQTLDGEQHDGD